MSQIDRYKEMENTQLFLKEIFGVNGNKFVYHISSSNDITINIRYLNKLGSMTETREDNHNVIECISEALNELSDMITKKAKEISLQKTEKAKQLALKEAKSFVSEQEKCHGG